MNTIRKQARFLVLVFSLLFSFVPRGMTAEDRSGAQGAGGEKTFSIGEVFDSVTDTLQDWLPDPKSTPREEGKPKTSEAKELSNAPQDTTGDGKKMIVPKKLDAEKPQQESDAPYKVYSTPVIIEGGQDYDLPERKIVVEQPEEKLDPKEPPPLPEDLKSRLVGAGMTQGGPDTVGKAQRRSRQGPLNVPATAALPTQFFPIFSPDAHTDDAPQLLPVASNIPLEEDHSRVTRGIIFIHDLQRNSAEGVATLMTLSGSSEEEPLILAPQFSLQSDIARFARHLPAYGHNVSRWTMEDPWQIGGSSFVEAKGKGITSFDAIDLLLLFLADRERFPVMEQIVLVGHGMGADFVQRYAALGRAPDVLEKEGIITRFVVANASSYLYLTGVRPDISGPSFRPANTKDCEGVLKYPYGMDNLSSYARRTGASDIRIRYPSRRILYLVGDSMINDNYIDNKCEAVAQGADRTTRAKNYARFLKQSYGDLTDRTQLLKVVYRAGYDPVSLFGSPCGIAVIFGAGTCEP